MHGGSILGRVALSTMGTRSHSIGRNGMLPFSAKWMVSKEYTRRYVMALIGGCVIPYLAWL
jgi:fermentation-respiration switch protein FrsA (DUF1100 family)